MAKFMLAMCLRTLEHRYYCYGLFNSRIINIVLLWSIIPIGILAYLIMYKWLPADAIYQQWDANFISESIQFFFMGLLIYSSFQGTRHAGMATSVLIYFIFHLINSIRGVYMKVWWFGLSWKLVLLGMVFFTFYKYFKGAKKDNHVERTIK